MANRCVLLIKIHIAKKDLKLTDAAYKAELVKATGKDSCSTMSRAERQLAIDHFITALEWKPKKAKPKKDNGDWRSKRIGFIKGLWKTLGLLSALDDPSPDGLERFCKNRMKADKLDWATSQELNNIIEALKSWVKRES